MTSLRVLGRSKIAATKRSKFEVFLVLGCSGQTVEIKNSFLGRSKIGASTHAAKHQVLRDVGSRLKIN